MKNQNTAVTPIAYFNEQVEELIATSDAELRKEVTEKAELLAEVKRPSEDEDLGNSTSWIRAKYNALKSKVANMLNMEGLSAKGASISKRFDKRLEKLKERHSELESKIIASKR